MILWVGIILPNNYSVHTNYTKNKSCLGLVKNCSDLLMLFTCHQ